MEMSNEMNKQICLQERVVDIDTQIDNTICTSSLKENVGPYIHSDEEETQNIQQNEYACVPCTKVRVKNRSTMKQRVHKNKNEVYTIRDFKRLHIFMDEERKSNDLSGTNHTLSLLIGMQDNTTETTNSTRESTIRNNQNKFVSCMEISTNIDIAPVQNINVAPASAHTLWNGPLHEDCNTCGSDNGNGIDDLQEQVDRLSEQMIELIERLSSVENNLDTVNDILDDFAEDSQELRERLRVLYDMYKNTFAMVPSSAMNTGTPMLLYSQRQLEEYEIYEEPEQSFLQRKVSTGQYPNTCSTTTALFAFAFQEEDIDLFAGTNIIVRVGPVETTETQEIQKLERLGFGLSTINGKHIGKGGVWTGNYEEQQYEWYENDDLTKKEGFVILQDLREINGVSKLYWILQDNSGDVEAVEYLLPILMEGDDEPMYHYFQISNEPTFEGSQVIDHCIWTYISYTRDFKERKVSIELNDFSTVTYDVRCVTTPYVSRSVRVIKELPMPTYNIIKEDVGQNSPIAHNEHKACMRLLIEDSMEQIMIDLKESYQQMQEDLGNVPGMGADITSRYIDNLGVLWSMAAKSASILDYTKTEFPSANEGNGRFTVTANDGNAPITGMTLPSIPTGYEVHTKVACDFVPNPGASENVHVDRIAEGNIMLSESNLKIEKNGWEIVSRIENGDTITNAGYGKAMMNWSTVVYPAATISCVYPSLWSPSYQGKPAERRTYFHRKYQTLATSSFEVILPRIYKVEMGLVDNELSQQEMTVVDLSTVDENGVLHVLFYVTEMIPIASTIVGLGFDEMKTVSPDNPFGWYTFGPHTGVRFQTQRASSTQYYLATDYIGSTPLECRWEYPDGRDITFKMKGGSVNYIGIGEGVPPTVPANDTELQNQIAEVDTRVSQIEAEWDDAQNRVKDFRDASRRTPVYSLLSLGMNVASNLGMTHKLKAFTGVYAAASLAVGIEQQDMYMILEGACTFAAMSNLLGKSRNVKTGTYDEERDNELEDDPDYLPKIHLTRRKLGDAGVDPDNYVSMPKDDPSWNIESMRQVHTTNIGYTDQRIKNVPSSEKQKRENDAGRTYESQKGGNSVTLESVPLETLGVTGPFLRQVNDKIISLGLKKGYKKAIVKSANKNSTNVEHTRLVVNSSTLLDAPIKIPTKEGEDLKRDRFTHVAYIGVTEGVTSPMVATYGNLANKKSQLLGGNGAQKGKPGITSILHTTTETGTNKYVTTGDLGLDMQTQQKEAAVVQTLITGKFHSAGDIDINDGLSERTSKGYEILHNQSRNSKGLAKISSTKVPTIKGLSDYFTDIRSHQENFGEYNLMRNNCQNFAMDHYQALTQAVPRGSVPSTLTDMIATRGWSSDPTTSDDLANMRVSWVNSSYDLMENGMGTSLLDPSSLITEIALGESDVYIRFYRLSDREMVTVDKVKCL